VAANTVGQAACIETQGQPDADPDRCKFCMQSRFIMEATDFLRDHLACSDDVCLGSRRSVHDMGIIRMLARISAGQ
jgi:Fe-S-cluster formation regulator IscX/YfhJ